MSPHGPEDWRRELGADDDASEPRHAGKRFRAESVEELEEAGATRDLWEIANDQSQRLDVVVANRIKSLSRNQAQRLLEMGAVLVNGKPGKASQKLKAGDQVEVLIPPRPAVDIEPEHIPLEVLYEDAGFIAINKPRGIIVHPARSNLTGTMVNALLWHFQNHPFSALPLAHPGRVDTDHEPAGLSKVGQSDARPGVIHRLDKDTTGVILFGKREEEHWKIATQFEFRRCSKAYLAVVHGTPDTLAGVVEHPLGKHPTIREAMCVRHDSGGKSALSLFRVRERYAGYSLVEIEIKTGRTHQIRVHMGYEGFPLVGDTLYGGEPVGAPELAEPPRAAGARAHINFARTREEGAKVEALTKARRVPGHALGPVLMDTPALHAGYLKIFHPLSGEPMEFTAPLHEPMLSLVRELRKRPHKDGVAGISEGCLIDLAKTVPEA